VTDTQTRPWHEISKRYERHDSNNRLRRYVVLKCRCGTVWECRADNLARMLSRECWHKQEVSP
jgi:hypothetical protein